MKVFCSYIQVKIRDRFGLNAVFVSRKRRHIHFAFKFILSDYDCFDKLMSFVSDEWERRKIFFSDYEKIYPRLISSMKWKDDCVFYGRNKKMS